MTTAEIAKLKRLEKEATPGPWKAKSDNKHKGDVWVWERARSGVEHIGTVYCGAYDGHGAANAALIAGARNALPALLDYVDRLEARVNAKERQIENRAYADLQKAPGAAQDRIHSLLARIEALEAGLRELVTLKDLKDAGQADSDYAARKPRAWEAARALLAAPGEER